MFTTRYCAKCCRDLRSLILTTILRDNKHHFIFQIKKKDTDVNRLAHGHSTKKVAEPSWELGPFGFQHPCPKYLIPSWPRRSRLESPPSPTLACGSYYHLPPVNCQNSSALRMGRLLSNAETSMIKQEFNQKQLKQGSPSLLPQGKSRDFPSLLSRGKSIGLRKCGGR